MKTEQLREEIKRINEENPNTVSWLERYYQKQHLVNTGQATWQQIADASK